MIMSRGPQRHTDRGPGSLESERGTLMRDERDSMERPLNLKATRFRALQE